MDEQSLRLSRTCLAGGGEMGALIRAYDWSLTSLGAPETWPQSLRTSLSILLNSKHQMFLAWGSGLLSFYNDACRPIMGARHPAALGKPFSEVWADIWPAISPMVEQAVAGEGTWSEDLPFVTNRSGYEEVAYFTFSYSPIRDESGAVAGMLCACTETTAKVRAEVALRNNEAARQTSEERLRTLFEQTPGFVAVVQGPDHIFEMANQAYQQLVGPRDLIGRAVRDALPEVAEQGFVDLLDQVYTSGKPHIGRGTKLSLKTDPTAAIITRYADFIYQPMFAADGSITGIFAQGSDVTDHKRTEADLRESEAQFRDFAEVASDWFWETDAESRYVKVVGQPTSVSVIGKTRWELAGADLHSQHWQEHYALVQAGEPFRHFEYKVVLNGQTFYLSASGRPLFNEDGTFRGYRGATTNITARREAELRAAEKAAFLEATLENMDQGLMVMDPAGHVTLFNQRALTLLDLPHDLLASHPRIEEVRKFQESRGEFEARDDALLKSDQAPGYLSAPPVYERTRPNGTIVEFRTVRLPNGGAVRTYADVTAQRQAEAELRASEGRYRALVEASAAMVWRAAPDGSIVDGWGWEAFCGQTPEEHTGHGWLEAVHPDDRDRVIAIWQESLEAGQVATQEYRVRHVNGEYRWTLAKGVPLRGSDGAIQEWVGTLADIHDQKETEARLLLRDRSLAAIAQGVLITDAGQPDHPIIYANPAFERITGYSADEVIGRNCRFLQGSETDRIALSRIRAALQHGHAAHETLINYTKHGVPFTNELTISPVRGPDGNVTHFVGVQSDVSARQRLEAQLRQSQKMEAVGQLTGGLAHDFNNLLAVILGSAELLIEESSDPTQIAALSAAILEAAERGAELTQRLLAFGRRQSLKPVRLPLAEAVSRMVPLLQRTLGEHIELRTEFVATPLLALTDRTLLESAILNLVVNARDAMPKDGMLTIRTAQRAAGPREGQLPMGQDVVVVTVSDTGTGMEPDVLGRIFEPFFTTKEVGKGSGLGLAMVYGFAQQSGGHVSVKSEPGQGTSVSIILPAVVAQPIDENGPPVSIPHQRGKERLLVVEDSPQVLQFVSAQLLSLGYDVTAVTNGPEALDVLKWDDGFDLLLTDLVLPKGMSGVDLARAARAKKPDLKVVFTSGYSEEIFEQHGRLDDDTPLLRKPFKRKHMAEMLRQVLDGPASTHAPAEAQGRKT